jgi:hypothetical protein
MSLIFNFVNRARSRAVFQTEREATVLRAFTGAGMLLGETLQANNIAEAATSVAVCPRYVLAAKHVLEAGDERLLREVLRGELALVKAEARASARMNLVRGFRNATPEDLQAFVSEVGVAAVWDTIVVPAP